VGVIDLVVLAAVVVFLEILLLSNTTDTRVYIDDTPDNEITNSQTEFDTSAGSTITITMYSVDDE
jgi:hypothetical protein